MSNRVSKNLFKAFLRWHKQNSDAPFVLRTSDINNVLNSSAFNDLEEMNVAQIARHAFRERATWEGEKKDLAVEVAFESLRELNTTYSQIVETMRQDRTEHTDRNGIDYSIGSVFQHAKFGYKGVIYGWDRTCTRDEEWIKAANTKPDQPFYSVLVDEFDSYRLFRGGAARLQRYVAQDNIIPLEDGSRVTHRGLDSYFVGFNYTANRYVPTEQLKYVFPDETYPEVMIKGLEEDTNLLMHRDDEEERGEDSSSAVVSKQSIMC